jgi:radical SAM-linked protein
MQRLRIDFSKTPAMKFTGHLDLHRTWERTFRRARLPLAYTQGFNPHPRIALACALPLGFTSDSEIVDVWLESDNLPLNEIQAALERALPPGMQIIHLAQADPHAPALQTQVEAAEYTVTLLDPLADLEGRVAELLAAGELPRRRRNKDYDLRPLVLELQVTGQDAAGHQTLRMRLSARENATGRPDEVVAALGADPLAARIHRTRLYLQEPQSA